MIFSPHDLLRRKGLLAAALIAFAAWQPSVAANEQATARTSSKTEHAAQAAVLSVRGSAAGPITSPSSPLTHADQAMELKMGYKKIEPGLMADEFIATFTAIAALATIALAVITALLARFTFKLWKDTGKLVEETSTSSERQLRAYVGIAPSAANVKVQNVAPENSPAKAAHTLELSASIQASIKNHGLTPATRIDSTASWAIASKDEKDKPQAAAVKSPNHGGGVLMPNEALEAPFDHKFTITQQDHHEIFTNQTKILQIIGLVDYTDAFGKRRKTKFNWSIEKINGDYRVTIGAQGNEAT